MQLNSRKARAQFGPFRFGFLHPVLAKAQLTGFENRQDALRSLSLAHRDKAGFVSRRDRSTSRRLDPGQNGLEILGGVGGYWRARGGPLMASAGGPAQPSKGGVPPNTAPRPAPLVL